MNIHVVKYLIKSSNCSAWRNLMVTLTVSISLFSTKSRSLSNKRYSFSYRVLFKIYKYFIIEVPILNILSGTARLMVLNDEYFIVLASRMRCDVEMSCLPKVWLTAYCSVIGNPGVISGITFWALDRWALLRGLVRKLFFVANINLWAQLEMRWT